MSDVIEPGATLGVLGGGQLGRMFALAARRMGYRVHVLSPDDDTPTGQVADVEIRAAYDDIDAVNAFARGVSAVTFEFENVPADTAQAAAKHAPVRPGGQVLHVAQNRLREKTFLRGAGLPVTPFAAVRTAKELDEAIESIGTPAVLKTVTSGYDGKGQSIVRTAADARRAWAELGVEEAILEAFIEFERELSVVAVRGLDGAFDCFGPMDNRHRNHILDVSLCPADVPAAVTRESIEIARAVMEKLRVVGVLCVEYFLAPGGRLLVNELAPRPHNSGHLTIDAHASCQFEQQVRAVCGLPLGSTRPLGAAAMANLLGEVWPLDTGGEPDWSAALRDASIKLHLYGKRQPRRGRKMGHLTALADTASAAADAVVAARDAAARREPKSTSSTSPPGSG